MRKVKVFYKNDFAGILEETENGFKFAYDDDFKRKKTPLSVSLPLGGSPFISAKMFPFFEGLLPEGWYLDIISAKYKIDKQDTFGIMLATFGDTVGAVRIEEIK
ncbi:MAG: HipA N-terminal domain-containing protein [Elusimicrobiota bacterium]|jgi:serine/threonine-protein kinase HipA|nr:HipA N-terminal domain-containing protein [Elusimicrobiota bacterium]